MPEKKSWLRQKGEPNLWFRRFDSYRRLGRRRSLLAVYNAEREEDGKSAADTLPGAWNKAAKQWNWKNRAEAWDDQLAAKEEAEWEEKRQQLREREWKTSQALLDKAEQMLVYPLAKTSREEKDEAGRVVAVTTVLPTRWGMRDAAALVEVGSKLGRLAADLNTAKTEVAATIKDQREVRQLSDEELAAIVLNDDEDSGRGDRAATTADDNPELDPDGGTEAAEDETGPGLE